MNFALLIKKYKTIGRNRDIVQLLHKHQLFTALETATNRFYEQANPNNKQNLQQLFDKLVQNYSVAAALFMQDVKTDAQREEDAGSLLHFISCLISEAVRYSQLEKAVYSDILKGNLQAEPVKLLWKEFAYYYFLGDIEVNALPKSSKVPPDAYANTGDGNTYFVWQIWPGDKEKRISLQTFIIDLTDTFEGLRTGNTIAKLFKNIPNDYKITIPAEHLCAFLEIFRKLHQSKRIKCQNSRGLYHHLQTHLQAPPNDKLPNRKEYSKLNHESHHDTKNSIAVLRKISALQTKYCVV